MPLLEIVPSPNTHPDEVAFAVSFFNAMQSGHQPVVVKKELPGFVGNRLAFVLLREACHLVAEGVVSVEDVDKIVEASIGPRWAVTGPFKSYHYGGGTKGLEAFMQNLSGTMEAIWDDAGKPSLKGTAFLPDDAANPKQGGQGAQSWADMIVEQTNQAYGTPSSSDFSKRDKALKSLLEARNPGSK